MLIVGATALSVLISVEKSPAVFESPGISPLLGAGYQCDINSPKEVSVKNLVLSSLPSERPYKKGCEMAKIGSVAKHKRADQYFDGYIQIVEMNPINGGVEVFARAWNSTGKQYGFGKDGSVDIERFLIVNPPIMVPDGTTSSFTNETGQTFQRNNFKEDIREALLQSLFHTISVKKQKFLSANIMLDKRGHTTTTVYPDPDVEVSSVDGMARFLGDAVWATARGHAGSGAVDNSTNRTAPALESGSNSGNWDIIERLFTLYDTSSIADDATIDSCIHSLYIEAKTDNATFNQGLTPTVMVTASNTSLVAGDYGSSVNGAAIASALDLGSVTTAAYNNFTCNATGIANTSKTGITKFGAMLSGDQSNTEPTWAGSVRSDVTTSLAETAGTTQDPKLVIESTAVAVAPLINKPLIFFTQ